jgi:hypothetical protein
MLIPGLLKQVYPHWHQQGHRVERIYMVLSIIGRPYKSRPKHVDEFIQNGTTDCQLPFEEHDFQGVLSPGARVRFLGNQSRVLPENLHLEEGDSCSS